MLNAKTARQITDSVMPNIISDDLLQIFKEIEILAKSGESSYIYSNYDPNKMLLIKMALRNLNYKIKNGEASFNIIIKW